MFRRKWPWGGMIISDEGFEVSFEHKGVVYKDGRCKFAFGYEDGYLFVTPHQVEGEKISLSQSEIDQMVDRVVRALQFRGDRVDVFRK
jgi:hypothetical protein